MTLQPNVCLHTRLNACSRAASAAVILIGGLGLIGWALDITALKSVFPGLVTMKANTALAFVLAGGSLSILWTEQVDRRLRRIAQACAVIVALIGLLTLSQYLFGWDLGIDQFLFREPTRAVGTFAPGRMAPTTALNFLMIGLALLLLDTPRDVGAIQCLVLAAGLIGLLNVTGYVYGARALYGIAPYTEMAVHTAVAFIVLSVGMLWARPDRGLMAIPTGDNIGGVMVRRLLPAALGVPFLLGWLSVIGHRAGLYNTEHGLALFGLWSMIVLAVIVWWNAGSLYRMDADRKRAGERLQTAHAQLEERVEDRIAQWRALNEFLRTEITERKQAEEALRESEKRFRILADTAPVMVWMSGLDGLCTFFNKPWLEFTGRTMEQEQGNGWTEGVHPEDLQRCLDTYTSAFHARENFTMEYRLRRADGEHRWVLDTGVPRYQPDGSFVGYIGSCIDITERKQAEEALRESEVRKGAILESALDGIITIDHAGRVIEFNPAAEKMFGYTRSEVMGRDMAEVIIPPALRERHRRGLAHYLATGEGPVLGRQIQMPAVRADGTEFPVELAITCIRLEGPPIFTGYIRDISERKRAEETLRAFYQSSLEIQAPLGLRERLDRILRTAQTVVELDRVNILLADSEGRMLRAVASMGTEDPLETIQVPIGPEGGGLAQAYLTKQMIVWDGMAPVPELLRLKPPYDRIEAFRSKVFANLPLIVQGQAIGVLGADRKRTRRPLDAAMLELLQLFAGQAALAIEHGRLYEAQGMAAIQLEATVEARTRDLQAANVRLEEATRVAEEASRHKSEFLTNMSHELRTPLNSILGFSELLAQQAYGPLTDKQARHVANIRTAGEHLLALINDLLDLSKVEAGKLALRLQTFSLPEAMVAVLREIHPIGNAKSLALKLHVDAAPATLTADPVRFRQILYNLFSNAVKFTPDGGRVTVTARRVPSSEFRVPGSGRTIEGAQPGTWNEEPGTANVSEYVEISVADTGIGIRAEDLPKLFQPFAQLESALTKQAQGSGLGLALTRRLVELHGGAICAESEGEGRGSAFRVRLPLSGPRGTPRVIVVDDDEVLLATLRDVLEAAGYQVATVRDGANALEQVAAARPDLLILDLRLPTVDGWAVLRQLRADPETRALPVLAITGVDVGRADEVMTAGADEFLTKPFSLTVLESTVRRLLLPAVSAGQLREPQVTL